MAKRRPGVIRDAIVSYLSEVERDASVGEITQAVEAELGQTVAPSSVRSYLRLGDDLLTRTAGGATGSRNASRRSSAMGSRRRRRRRRPSRTARRPCSRTTVSPGWRPAGAQQRPRRGDGPALRLVEYSGREQAKLRAGRGGVWRLPPSFDGHVRSPVPRFTVLSDRDLARLESFFLEWARALYPVLVPGANVLVASNPLVSYRVAAAVTEAGFERGEIVTGDDDAGRRSAEERARGVSRRQRHAALDVGWLTFRKRRPRQDNLRKWGVGGFRRISADRPFGDVIVAPRARSAIVAALADRGRSSTRLTPDGR